MNATQDPAGDAARRFVADLRANTTRTADPEDDPAWHAMALVAYDLFGRSASEAIIMASRLSARSREEIDADRAEIAAATKALGQRPPDPQPT